MAGELPLAERNWSIQEVARILGVPKPRIEYFCAKKAVIPGGAARGKAHSLSMRNIFEISLALHLSKCAISAAYARVIIEDLAGVEAGIRERIPGFRLPDGIPEGKPPALLAVICDCRMVSFMEIGKDGKQSIVFGTDLATRISHPRARADSPSRSKVDTYAAPDGSEFVRSEVNLTRIAEDVIERMESEGQ